jgi:glycerate 2-kinase
MINNLKVLAKNPLRKKALLIANAGYEAINIERVVRERIIINKNFLLVNGEKIDLRKFHRIFILGIGKGSALASLSLAKILGKRLSSGIALDVNKPKSIVNSSLPTGRQAPFKVLIGDHPLPSKKNIKATQEIIKLAQKVEKDDLIIAFICGGGSALLCGSEKEMKNSILATKRLTEAGADIVELNTVRKHLSEVKGGGLARLAYPATILSFIASDVPTSQDDVSIVASGPFVFDKTIKKDAEKTWKKYFKKNAPFEFLETPKNKEYFKKVKNNLLVSNQDAISAMIKKAKQLQLKPILHSLKVKGEAKNTLSLLTGSKEKGKVVLAGGETTVTLKGKNIGKGGRNQEAVLGAITQLNTENLGLKTVFVSFASDGHDNTKAAGAVGDYLTMEKAKKLKLDPKKYLENHDSFNFFKKTGDLIYADKTSFNVSDLMILLKK